MTGNREFLDEDDEPVIEINEGELPIPPDFDEVFADHIKEKREEHDRKMSIPVSVKSKDQEDLQERDRKEQEMVYRDLSQYYCLCNHKMIKHDGDVGKCRHQSTMMFKGKLTTYECECQQFVSLKDQSEQNF